MSISNYPVDDNTCMKCLVSHEEGVVECDPAMVKRADGWRNLSKMDLKHKWVRCIQTFATNSRSTQFTKGNWYQVQNESGSVLIGNSGGIYSLAYQEQYFDFTKPASDKPTIRKTDNSVIDKLLYTYRGRLMIDLRTRRVVSLAVLLNLFSFYLCESGSEYLAASATTVLYLVIVVILSYQIKNTKRIVQICEQLKGGEK